MPLTGRIYSLPEGNPVVGGTRITSSWANTTLSDIGSVLTTTTAQLQDSSTHWLSTITGNDTITGNATPAITSYVAGQTFRFVSNGANITGNVTLAVNGLSAKSVTKSGNTALLASDIPSGAVAQVVYDGTRFQLISGGGSGNGATGGFGDKAFFENDITIAHDYTITTDKNAMSAGPVTLSSGVGITVPNGSVWTVI